jgi:AcrR family transcriptional regulator
MQKRMKSTERRAAIVQSAIHVFAEKGFRGTTTRELAAALRVTEPVLYQHFQTKRDLYDAIIEFKVEESARAARGMIELARGDDDRAFFGAVGDLILSRFEEDTELTRLLLYSSLERHELSELFFDRAVAGFYRIVAGYIRKRARAGAFRRVQAETAARALIGMFHYHGLLGMLHPDRVRAPGRKKLTGELVSLFLGGVAAAAEG